MAWDVIYEKAVRDDGSLYFPERLSPEFLESQKRSMGSYLFANQYQNEIIPVEEQRFKPSWFRYYSSLPQTKYTFAFIDPAIGQEDRHDYTATVVIDTDPDATWYTRVANRDRKTPTQIVDHCFQIYAEFKPQAIGIEVVAYQEALMYLLAEEMKRRQVILPVKGIRRSPDRSKEMRILSLVPRFEWGRCYLAPGLTDLESELSQFPRGSHDDLADALASCEDIVYYPAKETPKNERPAPNSPEYESWYIRNLLGQNRESRED